MAERKKTAPKPRAKKEEVVGARTLLVLQGKQEIRVTVPAGSRVTFGPWTPPNARDKNRYDDGDSAGTLRIYQGTSIIGCFTNVREFRDVSLEYAKVEFVETGSKVWKKDDGSFEVQEKVQRTRRIANDKLLTAADEDEEEVEF